MGPVVRKKEEEWEKKGGPLRNFFLYTDEAFSPLLGNEREALCNGEDAIIEAGEEKVPNGVPLTGDWPFLSLFSFSFLASNSRSYAASEDGDENGDSNTPRNCLGAALPCFIRRRG